MRERATDRSPPHMIQLPSNFLSGFTSPNAQREMWLKLEFPLAGEAEKQENRGRGERQRERLTALSLHKQNIC